MKKFIVYRVLDTNEWCVAFAEDSLMNRVMKWLESHHMSLLKAFVTFPFIEWSRWTNKFMWIKM